MTLHQPTLPASEVDFLEWSRRWEAARSRAGLAPMAVMAAGVLGGMALHSVLRPLLPRPWSAVAITALMVTGFALGTWLRLRADDRTIAAMGKMCGHCERVIEDSRAVVKNGGRCTACGGQLYASAA
jgi:hypothetical protein